MKKGLFYISILAMLCGCVTSQNSMTYRPKNSSAAPYMIVGQVSEITDRVTVSVNGEKVIDDTLSFFSGSGEFTGQYKGHQVSTSCQTVAYGDVKCTVHIDAELVGTF